MCILIINDCIVHAVASLLLARCVIEGVAITTGERNKKVSGKKSGVTLLLIICKIVNVQPIKLYLFHLAALLRYVLAESETIIR